MSRYSLAASPWYPLNFSASTRPNGKASKSRNKSRSTRIIVNERFTIVDDSRQTPAYGRYAGLPHRKLQGEIWRPAAAKKPAPLVVYNHGFMSYRREGMYLARFLAGQGYTVVAVDFPLTGVKAPGKPLPGDIVNQPGDISFLLDYMLERNGQPGDGLYDKIDPGKIAVTGLSLGSLTSNLVTYHRRLLDPRIRALVSIAGPTSMFSSHFYAGNPVPALMIYGDSDSLVHYDHHALTAFERMDNATLVTLRRGSHTGFAQPGATLLRFLKNPDSLPCTVLKWKMDDQPWDFVTDLGGADMGIVEPDEEIAPLSRPKVRVAMKASRQHMFTNLATHAFLESHFAGTPAERQKARGFLCSTLPRENIREVAVMR